jgi:transposase
MKEFDGRRLDHKTREQIRLRAVQQIEAGESPEVIAKGLGFHRSCVYEWVAKYREGGLDALRTKPIAGRPRKLTGKHLEKLYGIITSKSPLQLKFPFALWTRSMIRELIHDEFDVRLSDVSVGRLLRKLGLSPQKPLYRAYQQDAQAVERWRQEEYPAIKKQAKRLGATIYFEDESAVRSDYHSGTTWAPVGKTPVVRATGARFRVNLISAISAQGALRFMVTDKRLTAPVFIDFLKRLLHGARAPVFLILDGHPVHRSAKVRKFAASTDGQLHLFFLPTYSPELNPDELVWNHLKRHRVGKTAVTGPDDLKRKVIGFLRSLQKLPAIVRAFFQEQHVRYASA